MGSLVRGLVAGMLLLLMLGVAPVFSGSWSARPARGEEPKRCPAGQVLLDGEHCCWPRQEWSAADKRCTGAPRCPSGMLAVGRACKRPPKIETDGVRKEDSAGRSYIYVEGGDFMMGSAQEKGRKIERPRRKVEVRGFFIGEHEVTVAEYEACVKAEECPAPDEGERCNWGRPDRDLHPVNCLSWHEARAYCEWAGARLCSEAEREYAARSRGREQDYPWGDDRATCRRAVMMDGGAGCGEDRTWPVCSKPLGFSAQGECDLAGNVWEWTEDDWHGNYEGAPSDGRAWVDDPRPPLRAIRGGSFLLLGPHVRASYRLAGVAARAYDHTGVRCCRDEF